MRINFSNKPQVVYILLKKNIDTTLGLTVFKSGGKHIVVYESRM